ncbi:MAG: glycosyltransferase family 4 protein [Eubacteriales bacterium]
MHDFFVADNVILPAVIAVSLVFSFAITPFARESARIGGVLDIPLDNRRMHKKPIPLMGGTALIISFVLTLIIFFSIYNAGFTVRTLILILGSLLCGAFGIIDDVYALSPFSKLLFQFVISVFAALFFGRIEAFTLFGATFSLGVFSFPVTVLWILFMMNAINLTDGMDGLCAGISAICAFALSVLLYLRSDYAMSLCAACICGACIGFLPYNSAPASVFMGETGSAFLGFVLSVLAVSCFSYREPSSASGIFLIFILPISETVSSFFRRVFHGKNPFSPDKKHIHHILYSRGFSVMQVSFILYAFTAISALCAVIYSEYAAFAAVVFASSVVFIRLMLDERHKKTKKKENRL